MEENKEKNAEERLADLIEKLSRATTFETVREYSREMKEYISIIREGKQREKEEYIACLSSNLERNDTILNHANLNNDSSIWALESYKRSKRYLEEAKEFDYLPTVKRLSEDLAEKVNKWKKGRCS